MQKTTDARARFDHGSKNFLMIGGARIDSGYTNIGTEQVEVDIDEGRVKIASIFAHKRDFDHVGVVMLDPDGAAQLRDWLNEHVKTTTTQVSKLVPAHYETVEEKRNHIE